MPAGDPRFPGLSVEDPSLASWLAVADRASGEGTPDGHSSDTPSGSTLRLPVMVGLVKADLVRKWRSGQPVSLESYLEALPELGTRDTIPAELILAEYEERRRSGVAVDLEEYAGRFPCQAEMLRQLIARPPDAASGVSSGDDAGQVVPSRRPPTVTGLAPAAAVRLPRQFGRYRIIKRLGRGGMGTVYLAYDSQLDRRVALKVPHITTPGHDAGDVDRNDLDRFHREVRAAATLHHPNLCPVYDQGQVGGVYYVTMAYLRGRPLSSLIDRERLLSQRWVAAAVRKLALALAEAHSKGVIHRDLKPSNIMVTSQRELVIMDFGLAWRVGTDEARLTKVGSILGTPSYMSPEQLSGIMAAIGPRCDIYSLGVILYELLTARRPFEGPATAVMAQILFKDPQPPSAFRPDLDSRLEAICLKAMAKKGGDRHDTMGELATALGRYLRDPPASTRSPPHRAAPRDGADPVARDVAAEATASPAPPVEPIPAGDPSLPDARPGVFDAGDRRDPVAVDPIAGRSTPRDELAPSHGRGAPDPDRPTGIAPTPTLAPDEPAGEAGAPDPDPELKLYWRSWTGVVELFALRRAHRRVDPEAYRALHGKLVRACRSRVEASDEVRRPLYERLEALARPFLTLKMLVELDREMLFDLLIRCWQAELELHGRPRDAQELQDRILAFRESANRPMSLAARSCFALGMCLGLFLLLAMMFLAVWQPDRLLSLFRP